MDNGKLKDLLAAQDDYKQKSTAADEAEEKFKALRDEVWEQMADEESKTISIELEDGTAVRFTRTETVYGRILDMDTAIAWAKETGRFEELFKTGEQKGRLNEFVRTELEAGNPLPEGLDFYSQKPVSITRKK